jgi:citrate lyase subunit beta/citryl-CoA lyase
LKARASLSGAVKAAGKGGSRVFVRVNNEHELLIADVRAAAIPGVYAIFVPKVESADLVRVLDAEISALEQVRNIEPNSIRLSVHIESPRGILNLEQILGVSNRIESVSIGTDDYCLQLGVEPSEDGRELFYPFSVMVTVSRALGVLPMGVLGSVAGYKDPHTFRKSAERARSLGGTGAFCIHPDQVSILNEVFTHTDDEVLHARRIVTAFENALANGRASTTLDDKMVDTPIYKRALAVIEHARETALLENAKLECMRSLGEHYAVAQKNA